MVFEYLEEFGKAFVPKKMRPEIGKYLSKAGIEDVPYRFFGWLFMLSVVMTYFIYIPFIFPVLKEYPLFFIAILTFFFWFTIQIGIIVVIILSVYFYLNIKIYQRTKIIEDLLPDYLALVSTNLKGGMHFEKSLWAAIKSEFGILAKEIGIASKKVATGTDVIDALDEFSAKYDSPILRRSIDLLKGEMISGGRVADVIDNLVENLRKTKQLKEEMVATALSYMIFMAAIVIVITPALFALSKQLLTIILGISAKIGASSSGGASTGLISFTASDIDPAQFDNFAMMAIATISSFTSIIISIIEKGDVKGGVKYIPLFLISSLVLYLIASWGLGVLMGNLVVI